MPIASIGTETQVNTTTTGDQSAPQAITLADGTYVVVWTTATGWSVQQFAADGSKLGNEVAKTGYVPATWEALPDGRLAYAYVGGVFGFLYFGILNGDGSQSLPTVEYWAFGIDTVTGIDLATNSFGDIFVAASSTHATVGALLSDVDGHIIYGTSIAYQGNPGHQGHGASHVRIALSPDGSFLAVYDRQDEGVQARYLDPQRTLPSFDPEFPLPIPLGAEVVHGFGELYFAWVETDTNGNPNVAVGATDGTSFDAWWTGGAGTSPSDVRLWQLADGRLLVTWTASTGGDGDGKSVMGQVVAFGTPIGDAFVINSSVDDDQSGVSIAALLDGRFVATWQTPGIDGNGLGIASQIFNPLSYTGTEGNDFWLGGAFDDTIVGGNGNDTLGGLSGDDHIFGGDGADVIVDEDGDDTMEGGDGDDVFIDGPGVNVIDGGDGYDVFVAGGDFVNFNFARGSNGSTILTWTGAPAYGTKILTNVETIRFANGYEESLPLAIPVLGTSKANKIDTINKVNGRGATDWDDDIYGYAGNDTIKAAGGNDRVHGDVGNDSMNGDEGDDTLWGDAGNDRLFGDNGSDTASGGAGNDSIYGGDAGDTLRGDAGNDKIFGDNGEDSIFGDLGNDTLAGGDGHDTADGGAGNDSISGNEGDDVLAGGDGADKLFGDNGKDTLTGGLGKDTLTGGNDADHFVFDTKPTAANVDAITDFTHGIDLIVLDDAIFSAIGASLTADQFFADPKATKAADAMDRIIYNTKTGKLYYDEDGLGGKAAVHFAVLAGKPPLDADDFIII